MFQCTERKHLQFRRVYVHSDNPYSYVSSILLDPALPVPVIGFTRKSVIKAGSSLATTQNLISMTSRLRLLLGGEWIASTTDYSIECAIRSVANDFTHTQSSTNHKIAILPLKTFTKGSLVGTNSTLYDLQGGQKIRQV